MKPKDRQFKTCDSCGKEIAGEAKAVKLRGVQGHNYFHTTPDECASAPDRAANVIRNKPTLSPNYQPLYKDDEEVDRSRNREDVGGFKYGR